MLPIVAVLSTVQDAGSSYSLVLVPVLIVL
jgi:hypothetical protein